MKKNLLLIIAIIVMMVQIVNAQWSTNPLNPTVVSNSDCYQNNVQQVADGHGGTFVFWTDSRGNCNAGAVYDVYGQHYDSLGVALWETNGRLILDYYSSILSFMVVRSESDGEMIIGSIVNPSDSLRFQKLDEQGAKMWENDLLVGKNDGCVLPTYIIDITTFRFFRDNQGYCVAFEAIYCGGSNGHRITRFNSNGVLTGYFNGEPEGSQNYSGAWGIDKTYDGTNDIYLFYTNGNGSGAHANILRVNVEGDTIWGPVDVLDGTNGINYFYDAKSDSDGIAVCFHSTGISASQDIFMRKWNPNGTPAWAGATTIVCGADGAQDQVNWQQDENFYYVCWGDGRPGVSPGYYDIYAQKIDKVTGSAQWNTDGIEVFSQSTYKPYPECVVTAAGEMIVFNEASIGLGGFSGMKINSDGTLAWDSPVIVDNINYLPFYSDYQIIISEPNVIVTWAETNPSGGADGIYISGLPNPMVTIYDTVTACDTYISYGDTFTVSGIYNQVIPGDTLLTLNLTVVKLSKEVSFDGATLTATQDNSDYVWMDCLTGLEIPGATEQSFTPTTNGQYSAVITQGICEVTSECKEIIITNAEEILTENSFIIFPNPFKENFMIKYIGNIRPLQDESYTLEIMDVLGKKVHEQLMQLNTIVSVPLLPEGIYCMRLITASGNISRIIVKH
jgi:hypothetical protein